MIKIAVCICTYNRTAGLRLLLNAIERQEVGHADDSQITLVVVDNGETRSAQEPCAAHARTSRFAMVYRHERRKGLTFARNAALEEADRTGATVLVFVDDDEIPHPKWLDRLVQTLHDSGAPAAIGPVSPVFAHPPPRWLPLEAHATRRDANGGFADDGYTCNVALQMSVVREHHLRFDARFNETGGEDTLFFKAWRAHGLKIAWAEDAIVYETVPPARMQVSWVLRRWYRTGNTEAYLGRYDAAGLKGRALNLGRGAVRMAWGTGRVVVASAVHAWRRPDAVVASCYTLCRGVGLIAAALGRNYKEYSRSSYR